MSMRQGFFIEGQTVEIYGSFRDSSGTPMNDAGGIKVTIKRPDDTIEEFSPPLVDAGITMDVLANQVGIWRVRLECSTPSASVTEGKFTVVESSVLP